MPEGNCLCHSDFHPDNVLCNENGDYIIDWADCCNGNACADVAEYRLCAAKKTEKIAILKIIDGYLEKVEG